MNKLISRTLPFALSTITLALVGCSDNQETTTATTPSKATQEAEQKAPAAETAMEQQSTAPLRSVSDFATAAERAGVIFELPTWQKSEADIDVSVADGIDTLNRSLDAIAAIPRDQMNFENTIVALEDAYYPAIKVSERLDVIRETSPDKAMRDKARKAAKTLQAEFIKAGFRQDVYESVKAYADTQPELHGEDAMLLKITMRDYRRNGMDLSQDKKDELKKLKTELNEMGLEFAKNINEANAKVSYTREELEGSTEDFLSNKELIQEDGSYLIDGNVTWQYLAVMENVKSEEARKKLLMVRYTRAIDTNTPLFTRMLKTRAAIAQLLGYDHWADYRIEPKMAKTAATAYEFLDQLRVGLDEKYKEEIETLRQMKVAETGEQDTIINIWDRRYYENELKKTKYNIDTEQLKVFFEMDRTLQGMFDIFEEIFALKIEEVDPGYKWVDDLRLYAISDSGTGDPLGLIYMDMHPREGKYNHFAQFGVTPGKKLADGRYQRPVVGLVCNFPPATDTKPSLLTHDHVETLFHEFGHALHSVLTQTKYANFSGTSVPRDFVEAPSQMLENWIWDKSVLDRFAADYSDESRKIPSDILDKMEEARLATIASFYRRQLSFGIMDLELHSRTDDATFDNYVEFTNQSLSKVALKVPEGSAFVSSFGHLGGGYDAGYYGYAWADAISADMASVFEASPGKLMDHTIGRRLRDEIYATGGSREIDESIVAFLGRERSLDAFYEQIGLNQTQESK
ncbi:MAG: M3 family metallopeptidase [bacterium]